MTATLIAMLVEEGKLAWNTTVAETFPEFRDTMQPDFRSVTLKQLLSHHGGFPEHSWPLGKTFQEIHALPGDARLQRHAYAALALSDKPAATPGTKFIYSNMGYAIAGAMAEKVTGTAWEELLRRRLFRPLKMQSAGFGTPGSAEKIDQPWPHYLSGSSHVAVPPGPHSDNPPAIGPAGAVHCSLEDWAQFVSAHLLGERGTGVLLKPQTYRLLHTVPFGGGYALGWLVTQRSWADGPALSHAGSNTQNFADVWIAPRKNFAVLVATNQGGDEAARACDETASTLIEAFLGAGPPTSAVAGPHTSATPGSSRPHSRQHR